MTPEQFAHIEAILASHKEDYLESRERQIDLIKETIKTVVNGKIDRLTVKLDDFIVRADPAVNFFENVTWSKKIILGAVIFVGAIASALLAIKQLYIK